MTSIDRPLGPPVPDWRPPPWPRITEMNGLYTRLEALDRKKHGTALFEAYEGQDWIWDYMPGGPFGDLAAFETWLDTTLANPEHLFFAIFARQSILPAHQPKRRID